MAMATITRFSIILCCLLFVFQWSSAQQNLLDSMELTLKNPKITNAQKLRLYDDLSWEYLSLNFTKSTAFARKGIIVAQQAENQVMEATLMRNLGVAYYMDNRLDSAEIVLKEAIVVAKEGEDQSVESAIYGALGNLYNIQNRYTTAIEYYNKALSIYESLGRTDKVYTIKANIGVLFYNRRNYPQAEKYLLAAQKHAVEAGDIQTQEQIAQNLSNIYFAISKPEEAYIWAEKAVALCREGADEYNEVLALVSLSGACYLHLKDNDLATKYANEAIQNAKSIGLPNLLSASIANMAYVEYRKGNYQNSLEAAQEAISLTDTTDLHQLIGMYSTKLESQIKLNKSEPAIETFKELFDLMTQQSNEQISHALAEMEVQYETQKKEEKIVVLSNEKRLLWAISISLMFAVILLITALILYNRYQRQKRLHSEQQMRSFETQKQLLAAEWLLDGENRERSRLSRELHDGLGGLLTMAKLKLSQANASQPAILLIDNAITEMRRVSSNLMPEMLGRFGLRPTLSEYCKSSQSVDIHFYGDDLRYDSSIEMNLYRIACELINNALKHAEASKINIQLITEQDRISLIAQDNGKGFDTSSSQGNGLSNIKNRVSLMGATLDIFSTLDQGTEITIELKIKDKQ